MTDDAVGTFEAESPTAKGCEEDLTGGRYLVVVHGDPDEAERARECST
jgi:hypothetical protein